MAKKPVPLLAPELLAPQPVEPVRQFSFTDFQVNNPVSPPPGDRLDGEFDRTNVVLGDTIDWAATSLNTDGTLRPGIVGKQQFVPGLFDDITDDAVASLQPMVEQAGSYTTQAFNAVQAASAAAALSEASASRADQKASDAAVFTERGERAAKGAEDDARSTSSDADRAENAANHADGSEAVAQAYADVGMAWAEHMPDTIPPNILAVMGVTGDHWSSRWWANQAVIAFSSIAGLYLGPHPAPPAAMPGGGALVMGALYYDTLSNQMFIWTGTAWVAFNGFLPLSGGSMTGPLIYTATGGSTPRSAQDRAADSLNLLDYILPIDADATNGFNRVVAAARALNRPVEIWVPGGNYAISGPIPISISGTQGVFVRGAGSSVVRITQNADAAGFAFNITGATGRFDAGQFGISGLTLSMRATASTTRIAVSVNAATPTGAQPPPAIIDDLMFVSRSTTSLWAIGLSLAQAPSGALVSRISSTYVPGTRAAGLGTGIYVAGGASDYSATISFSDINLIDGAVGYSIGNYLQGLQFYNCGTVNTGTAVTCTCTAGFNEEFKWTGSYLHGAVSFVATAPGAMGAIGFTNCYFDAISGVLPNSTAHLSFTNCTQIRLIGNILNGPATASANITGLSVAGPQWVGHVYSGNLIQAYQNGGTAIRLAAGTQFMLFVGTYLINNTNGVVDAGSNNTFMVTMHNNQQYLFGNADLTGPTATNIIGAIRPGSIQTTGTTGAVNSFANLVQANLGLNVAGSFNVTPASGSANNLALNGAALGGSVSVQAFGGDTNIGLNLLAKGSGAVTATGLLVAQAGLNLTGSLNVLASGAGNNIAVFGRVAGSAPAIQTFGTDTDIGLEITPKGSGAIFLNNFYRSKAFTVATLPAAAAGLRGYKTYVTDNTASPVWNAAPTAGGTTPVKVWCDGASWRIY
jgi:hypothetical protein